MSISIVVKSLEPMDCAYFTNRGNCALTTPRKNCRERIKETYRQTGRAICKEFKDKRKDV